MKDKIVERLMKAVIKMHPNLAMDIPEQKELYLAYHACKEDIAHLYSAGEEVYVGCPECGAEIRYGLSSEALDKLKQSKLLTRPTVSERKEPIDPLDSYYLKDGKWHCVECHKPMTVSEEEIKEVIFKEWNEGATSYPHEWQAKAAKAIKELLNR